MSGHNYMDMRVGTFILRLWLTVILICLCACGGDGQKEPEKTVPVPGPEPKEVVRHALTYQAGANGGISGEKNQIVVHGENGSEVTAVPDEGYHFAGWSDGVEKVSRVDRQVEQDLSVKAEFAVNEYQLTYQKEGQGSIEGPVRQTVSHGEDGEPVTAVPAANHHFTGWSDGLDTARRHEINVTSDLSLTAKFAIDRFSLFYASGPHGTIKGEKQQVVDYGGSGSQVRAVPDEGYHFTAWSDGVETALRSEENVIGDVEVTAKFAVNVYSLVYASGEHGDISGERTQKVEHGGDGTAVTAVADPGYHFVKWSDGASDATRSEQNITRDLSFRALFEVNTYSVGGKLSGLVEGTKVALQLNENPVLVLEREGEYTFPAEMLDGEPYVVTVSVQPVSPNQICTVDQASGTVPGADVEDVQVDCQLETYKVGGTLAGLPEGASVILEINDKETLRLEANGAFRFDTPLEDGSAYRVTVSRPPSLPNWVCDVENAAGSLTGKDVGDILVDCYVKPVLRAIPGLRSISLDWNHQDFQQVVFNLCRAKEEIPADGFGRCQSLTGGMLTSDVSSPHFASSLASDEPYWFQLEAHYASGRKVYSEVVESMAFGGLNDSGVDWCADNVRNIETDGTRKEKGDSCHDLAGSFPGQDAHFGRDARARARNLEKEGYGVAGFDFTRVCRNGDAAGEGRCAPNPSPGRLPESWGCVRDNATGLTWEIKSPDGLQSRDHTYSWYQPDDEVNGGKPGAANAGRCQEKPCDTASYVMKINKSNLCGFSDWRVPTRKELLSIVNNGVFKPAVDVRFFPNTVPDYYWTSTPFADQDSSAWQVYFLYGEAYPDKKEQARHLRLVRGSTMTFGLDNP